MRHHALLACLLATCLAAGEEAKPALPLLHPLFSDAAVLQRDRPVAVWGWAAPGATVTVALAGDGLAAKPATATAGADGRWQAALGPFPAGGPYVLSASAGEAKAEAKDVLVGEVWLCSGQSNMEMVVKSCKDFEAEKAKADLPRIRHILVKKRNAGAPESLFDGKWLVCSPETVGGFTAAGFFMARKLHQDLGVPIGLVHSSWGGTPVEAWTSAERLATHPDFTARVAELRKLHEAVAAQSKASGKTYDQLIGDWLKACDPGTAATPAWSDPAFDAGAWATAEMPAAFEDAKIVPPTYDGTVWLRRSVTVAEADAGKSAMLRLGRIDDGDLVWVNGRVVGGAENPSWARNYRVPEKLLKAGDNSLAIRVLDVANKGGLMGKPADLALVIDGGANLPLAGPWRVQPGIELAKAPQPLPLRFDRVVQPTGLYNGMIAPLLPLTHAGAIWYQGEANAPRAAQYRALLPLMISDWRGRFAQGDLPFLIVQLANYRPRQEQPGESAWAELREAQALTARSLPKCGLAVAIDVGEAADIHPKNKQAVGERLALAAEAIAYGREVVPSGPWYREMAVEGAAIRLRFDHLGGGLIASDGKPLTGFAICGEDRKWVWAEARIDGETVVVSSPAVAKPVAVRYAWAENPACNLANKAGLPAVPFRTDAPR